MNLPTLCIPHWKHAMRQHSASPCDAIVVGGSYAGLSAALQLARARRSVLVIDTARPRNERAAVSHGWLGSDGRSGAEILSQARAELARYPTVSWHNDEALTATRQDASPAFSVGCASGAVFNAERIILAYGVRDVLPDVEGLEERWGRSVFSCPYCHGYELNQGRIGLLCVTVEKAVEQAVLLSDWGKVTVFCTDAQTAPATASTRVLDAHGIGVELTPVRCIDDVATMHLEDGRRAPMDGLFVCHDTVLSSTLATQLGCGLEDGGCITTDSAKQTTVDGVFACGDIARMAGSIALSVGEGALAGVAVHRSLMGLLER
jgi:thioredoxin reductase